MAFIPIPNCVKAELRLSYVGQEVENVFHFMTAGTPTEADLVAVAEGVETWWTDLVRPIVPNSVVYRETYVTDQSSQFGPVATVAGSAGMAGQLSLSEEPSHVTLAVSFRTANRGRSFRGRAYHIGIGQLDVVDNEVVPTRIAALRTAYLGLLQAQNFGGCQLAIASRRTNNADRVTGIVTPVLQVVIADPVVDSQRRRLPGRGR